MLKRWHFLDTGIARSSKERNRLAPFFLIFTTGLLYFESRSSNRILRPSSNASIRHFQIPLSVSFLVPTGSHESCHISLGDWTTSIFWKGFCIWPPAKPCCTFANFHFLKAGELPQSVFQNSQDSPGSQTQLGRRCHPHCHQPRFLGTCGPLDCRMHILSGTYLIIPHQSYHQAGFSHSIIAYHYSGSRWHFWIHRNHYIISFHFPVSGFL